jgi:regulator of nucleoside diphosphate kinase
MQSIMFAQVDAQPDIRVTKWDLGRLQHLLSSHATTWSWRAVEFLVRELMRAHIVDEESIPGNIVTMRSRVMISENDGGLDQVVTLAYPSDRDFYNDALSVLTPVGAALIGLSEGQSITYPGPDGRLKTLTVLKILSQPERKVEADQELPQHAS